MRAKTIMNQFIKDEFGYMKIQLGYYKILKLVLIYMFNPLNNRQIIPDPA